MRRTTQYLFTAALLAAALGWGISDALATTVKKPARDLVGAHLTVLEWHPLNTPPSFTKVVSNPSIVARVRALINALPAVVANPHQICPADEIVGPALDFTASVAGPVITKVVFQLGGCPVVQVYQRGKRVSPVLGGPRITSTYYRIQQLITPHGVSMN